MKTNWRKPTGENQLEKTNWRKPTGENQLEKTNWRKPTGENQLEKTNWRKPTGENQLEKTKWVSSCVRIFLAAILIFYAAKVTAQNNFNPDIVFALPGTIEIEQFNQGNSGVAYYNVEGYNAGGKFRTDGVSIYRCSDYGGNVGYCVRSMFSDSWLKYKVNNLETAKYNIDVRLRLGQANTTCTFSIIWGSITVANFTVSFADTDWHTVSATTTYNMASGTDQLTLFLDSISPANSDLSAFFDYMTLYKAPPAVSNPSTSFYVSNLSTSVDINTAKANAYWIQQAVNSAKANNGGTVIIPSGTYYVCQQNPIETFPSDNGEILVPMLATVSPSGNTTTATFYEGFQFTVGSLPLAVDSLGRWVVSGNSGNHWVKLVNQNGYDLQDSATYVNTYGQTANQFTYNQIPVGPSILSANTAYYLVSQEVGNGDSFYLNVPLTGSGVATVNTPVYGASPNYYASGTQGNANVPVNLLYKAKPAMPADNCAVLVDGDNITIQGTGSGANGTTLVAFNRATTIFYVGQGIKYLGDTIGIPVSNIVLQNITFQGNGFKNYLGQYDTSGLMVDCQLGWVYMVPLGSLVAMGGYRNGGVINWSQNLVVQNCAFNSPSSVGISLLWDKDVLITNCSFNYFMNNVPAALTESIRAWCGILALGERVEDVAVLSSSFNGNASMISASDYAADGLVWLGNGGKWIVKDCAITNYHYEGVQLNAGPYSVVSNAFCTLSTDPSANALVTTHNFQTTTLDSANSIYSAYCFVGNTVGMVGNLDGCWVGIRENTGNKTYGPYTLVVSANEFKLAQTDTQFADMLQLASSKALTVSGNRIERAGKAIYYGGGESQKQSCSIYALCNDFSKAILGTMLAQDGWHKLSNIRFQANRMGAGWQEHIILAGLQTQDPRPILTLQGNEFCFGGLVPFIKTHSAYTTYYSPYWCGCQLRVGANNLRPTYLGRWKVPGNTMTHEVRIVSENNTVLASVNVVNGSPYAPANEFIYAYIPNAPTLNLSTVYFLGSQEYWSEPFRQWESVATEMATSEGPAFTTDGFAPWNLAYYPGYMHGPVNFLCCWLNPAGGSFDPAGAEYQLNPTQQYYINSPNYFSDSSFSLY